MPTNSQNIVQYNASVEKYSYLLLLKFKLVFVQYFKRSVILVVLLTNSFCCCYPHDLDKIVIPCQGNNHITYITIQLAATLPDPDHLDADPDLEVLAQNLTFIFLTNLYQYSLKQNCSQKIQ